MRRFGLRSKLLLAFAVLLLPVLGLLVFTFRANLYEREKIILEDQRLTAQAIAAQIDGEFDAAIGLGWAVANDAVAQTFDPGQLDPHLTRLLERVPVYQAIGVFDSSGNNRGYGHLAWPAVPRIGIDRQLFQSVMGTNAPIVSQVMRVRGPTDPVGVVAAVPLRDNGGQAIGVVAVVMAADQLARQYEEVRLVPGQSITLADRGGRLAFHSRRRDLSYNESARFLSLQQVRTALDGVSSTASRFSDPITGDIRLGAFVPTPRYRWAVGVSMAPDVALGPVYARLRQQLLAFGAILLLSVMLATAIARYFARPFVRLSEAANALGGGDFSQRVDIRTGDEIDRLAASFNAMAAQIEERDRALRERESRIRRVVESNIIGIFFWNIDGGIYEANDAFLRVVGYTREELLALGQAWVKMTPDDHRQADELAIRELMRTGSCTPYDKEYLRKDGTRVPVLIGGAFFEGSHTSGVAFVLDLSQRKQAEVELKKHRDHLEELVRERTIELSLAKERAEIASHAKSGFLAGMSHELRTPLNAILGYAQILKRDKSLGERQMSAVHTIQHSGEHLLLLINDILDLSAIEAGKLALYPRAIFLQGFLLGVADIVRVKAEEKSILFVDDIAADLPGVVHVDDKRLRQVLLNLLGNAVKFTDRGEVRLRVRWLSSSEGNALLRFEVEDTGIGIEPNQIATMFKAFVQVGDVRRRSGGTGLGLAISRQLVRMMGGDIHVDSTPDRGSRFWFELALPQEEVRVESAPVERLVTGYAGDRKKILVVDDVEPNRAMIVDWFEGLGFVTVVAENGFEALDKVQSERPDLVLMDVVMPLLDGLEATRRLRQLPDSANIPIVVASASAADEDRRKSLAVGATDFVPKPIDLNRFQHLVGRLLQLTWTVDDD